MTKTDLVEILRDNAVMKDDAQEQVFFDAIEQFAVMPQHEFDESLFHSLCLAFVDDTERMDGVGEVASLLESRYLQNQSLQRFYQLLNKSVSCFFPHASGWLASTLAPGLYEPESAGIINSEIDVVDTSQARELYERLVDIFDEESLPVAGQAFLDKLKNQGQASQSD